VVCIQLPLQPQHLALLITLTQAKTQSYIIEEAP
jgi:hypothetical protein